MPRSVVQARSSPQGLARARARLPAECSMCSPVLSARQGTMHGTEHIEVATPDRSWDGMHLMAHWLPWDAFLEAVVCMVYEFHSPRPYTVTTEMQHDSE